MKCMIIMGAINIFVLNSALPMNYKEIYDKLMYSYEQDIQTGIFTGTQRVNFNPPMKSKEEIENEILLEKKYLEDSINKDINNLPRYWLDKIKKNYQTMPENIVSTPEVKEYFDYKCEAIKKYNTISSQSNRSVESVNYIISKNHGVRYEKDYTSYRGSSDKPETQRKDIGTVTKESNKLYTPSVHGGVIKPGDNTVIYGSVPQPHLFNAGKPFMAVFKPEDIKSVKQQEYDGKNILRVVISRDFMTYEFWVSPEKGYKTIKSKQYVKGQLWCEESYGSYKEIQPGYWYPMHQEVKTYDAELPKEIQDKLNSGEMSIYDDALFNVQIIKRIQYSMVRDLNEAEINIPIDAGIFDFKFPVGTTVTDLTSIKEDNMPLDYKVGDESAVELVELETVSLPPSANANDSIQSNVLDNLTPPQMTDRTNMLPINNGQKDWNKKVIDKKRVLYVAVATVVSIFLLATVIVYISRKLPKYNSTRAD